MKRFFTKLAELIFGYKPATNEEILRVREHEQEFLSQFDVYDLYE